jgi:hypothetical protein
MSTAMTMQNGTRTNRKTTNIPFLAFLTVVEGFSLVAIDGPPGRREFVVDREISTDVMRKFQASREKRLLDGFKSLKLAACLPNGTLPTF